jgi:uncharacterized membrane protein YhaH (DUF805 family)
VLKLMFSFSGRINRAAYWLATLIQAAVLFGAAIVLELVGSLSYLAPGAIGAIFMLIILLAFALATTSQLAALVKRSHDLGYSWLFLLLLFVPIIALWANIMLWFARGSTGPNGYGRDPLARRDIQKYSDAISRNPANARAFVARGGLLALEGEQDRAIEDLDTAIRLNPRDPEAFNGRAFVRFRLGRLEDARSDYDQALALNARNAEALFGRGAVRLRMSDQGGHEDIAAAKAINPRVVSAMASLGIA